MTYLMDIMMKVRAGLLGSSYKLEDTRYAAGASQMTSTVVGADGTRYRIVISVEDDE